MKMGDGGFRPGDNVRYAVSGSAMGGPRAIVGVNVTNVGSGIGSLAPMVEQIEKRTGQRPAVLMADGGHIKSEDISATRRMGVDVIVPPPDTAKTIDKLKAQGADPEVIAWRERMETDEAKQLFRGRAGLVELAPSRVGARTPGKQARQEAQQQGIAEVGVGQQDQGTSGHDLKNSQRPVLLNPASGVRRRIAISVRRKEKKFSTAAP